MLHTIKIVNFRSLDTFKSDFIKQNVIIGNNGAGKSNILYAIGYLFGNNSSHLNSNELIKIDTPFMYLEASFEKNSLTYNISLSLDGVTGKKTILLNNKKATKKMLSDTLLKVSFFSPLDMNLFYLGPKFRRDFLDNILSVCFPEYEKIVKEYETIMKNRNKVLKNIGEGQSPKSEIIFWNQAFIHLAEKIYGYRIHLNQFIEKNILTQTDIFRTDTHKIEYRYISKIDFEHISESIQNYLEKNFERDIILERTSIGPHIDDFEIFINDRSLLSFASRGEIKSMILALKLTEIDYIKEVTHQNPILLIDDLESELDTKHSNLILEKGKNLQIIYTSIFPLQRENTNVIFI